MGPIERKAFEVGQATGKSWGEDSGGATLDQLIRLQELRAGCRPDEWEWTWSNDVSSAYAPGERFVFAISPEHDGNRRAARDFWEKIGRVFNFSDFLIGDLMGSAEFVRGFAEGAIEARNTQEFNVIKGFTATT